MCGIAGAVSPDRQVRSRDAVAQMTDAIRHRGPDDEGIVESGPGTLGVRRLAIIDLAHGHQPMSNERGDVFAVQNGEIYNFEALRSDLEAKGHRFRTRSDTEVLPHAYEEWGTAFVARLRGMFAIALWDATRERLVLARDRFGKKPLVYADVEGSLLFASEIQALLTQPLVERDVDDLAISDYLTFGYIGAPRTAFRAVRKVPPGHTLVYERGRITIERYWRLEYGPKLRISFDEAVASLRERLDEAVRLRLISDVPLGAFLSGGLDSSTVVAFMARHSERPVKTFSVGFTDRSYDELRYARIVAARYGTDHQEFVVDASDTDVLPMLVRHLGEPFADSSIVPTYHVARVTGQHVTVALNGDGGDELFAGYNHYRAVALANRIGAAVPRSVLRPIAAMANALPDHPQAPRWYFVGRRLARASAWGRAERYLRWTGHFSGPRYELIAGDRLRGHTSPGLSLIQKAMDDIGSDEPAEREIGADVTTALAGGLLVKMDIATMACSLEARSPLLDHELAGFVARLPAGYKFSLTTSKRILRAAMRDDLPAEILARGKMGFSAPVPKWLRGPMRDMLTDMLGASRAADAGLISPIGARVLIEDHLSGRADNSRLLWNLLMLELWYRACAESPGRSMATTSTRN